MSVIVGAGLAGLIAAHAWPQLGIIEAQPAPRAAHRALLRFRTDAVARLVGIEFRRVRVRKGLWSRDAYQSPNIQLANQYSQKILGGRLLNERSVWSLDPVERWIAPEDLYDQLVESVGSRIIWGAACDFKTGAPFINTAPLPVVLATLRMNQPEFDRAAIRVSRWRVPNADLFQTVYFPDPELPLYRASMTGGLLIAEFAAAGDPQAPEVAQAIERAFGLRLDAAAPLGTVEQRYGKIAPIDESLRKHLLFDLTHTHNIYSLGRFATWRNILLDDVVDDIAVIKRLLRSSHYELKRTLA